MSYEERFKAIEARLGTLEAAEKARADHKAASDAANPFIQSETARPPAIPNGIDEVPLVGNIAAEKLGFLRLPDGSEFWAAVKPESGRYAEIVPGDETHCKNVPGTFDVDTAFRPIPAGTEILRKEYNEWYLKVRPAPKCRRVSGSWDLEPIS